MANVAARIFQCLDRLIDEADQPATRDPLLAALTDASGHLGGDVLALGATL